MAAEKKPTAKTARLRGRVVYTDTGGRRCVAEAGDPIPPGADKARLKRLGLI